jgi:hypothetical protein
MGWQLDKNGQPVYVLGEGKPEDFGESIERGPARIEEAVPGNFRIFPKSWSEEPKPPAPEEPLELPTPKTQSTFGRQAPDALSGMPSPSAQAEGLEISNLLDLGKLRKDMVAAQEGDPAAKARVQAMKDSPAVTSLGTGKPRQKPAASSTPLFDFSQGTGMSSSLGSVMPSLDEEQPRPVTLPTRDVTSQTFGERGGGGVEVPEQEKGTFDRSMGMGLLGDTLINFGNAIGNPRTPTATTGWTDKFRQEQMQALKMRHDMWQDAYSQAQQLPAEVMTMPEFAPLAKAKANLEKDMMDGRVDNEQNVSTLLTEMARYKGKLAELSAASKGRQAAAAQEATLTAQGNRKQELKQQAAAGDQNAAMILSLIPPTEQEKFAADEAERAANQAYRLSALAQQGADRDEDRAARLTTAGLADRSRADALDFRRKQSAAAGLNAMMRETLKLYGKADEEGNITNPEEAVNQMFRIHGDDIISAGEAIGLRIQKAGDAANPLLVVNDRPMNPRQGHAYILAQIRTAGGE